MGSRALFPERGSFNDKLTPFNHPTILAGRKVKDL